MTVLLKFNMLSLGSSIGQRIPKSIKLESVHQKVEKFNAQQLTWAIVNPAELKLQSTLFKIHTSHGSLGSALLVLWVLSRCLASFMQSFTRNKSTQALTFEVSTMRIRQWKTSDWELQPWPKISRKELQEFECIPIKVAFLQMRWECWLLLLEVFRLEST